MTPCSLPLLDVELIYFVLTGREALRKFELGA